MMRMFMGKDFTKDLARLEWKRPEDVVLRIRPGASASQKRAAAKKGQAAAKAKQTQSNC